MCSVGSAVRSGGALVVIFRHVVFCSWCSEGDTHMSVEIILQQLDNEIRNLTQARSLLAGLNGSSVIATTGKRIISAASRRKMAIAQRARRAAEGKKASVPNAGKRAISIAARKRMAAAQKARWAKIRAAKKAA